MRSGRRLSKHLYVIPFGKYRRHHANDGHGSARFVGREGARAFLVDALVSNSRRGAFLVTGRRGVGKSVFVEACIDQAASLKYRPYMRDAAGRSLIDQLAGVASLLVAIALLLGFAEFAQMALQGGDRSTLSIAQLLGIALTVFPLTLLVIATVQTRVVLNCFGMQGHNATPIALLTTTGGIVLTLTSRDLGEPVTSVSNLFAMITLVIVIGRVIGSMRRIPSPRWYWLDQLVIFSVAAVLAAKSPELMRELAAVASRAAIRGFEAYGSPIEIAIDGLLAPRLEGLQLALLLLSLLFTATTVKRILENVKDWRSSRSSGSVWQRARSRTLAETAARRTRPGNEFLRMLAAAALPVIALVALPLVAVSGDPPASDGRLVTGTVISLGMLLAATCLVVVLTIVGTRSRHESVNGGARRSLRHSLTPRRVAPVEAMTLTKALLLIVVSVHLSFPAIAFLSQSLDTSSSSVAGCTGTNVLGERGFALISALPASGCAEVLSDEVLVLTNKHRNKVVWALLFAATLLAIYACEHAWVARGLNRRRHPPPLDINPDAVVGKDIDHHLDRKWQADAKRELRRFSRKYGRDRNTVVSAELKRLRHRPRSDAVRQSRNRLRTLERISTPGILMRFWRPFIVVRINLGFDSLDHRGVIHAMLHGLRNAYAKTFITPTSAYYLLGTATRVLLLVAAVTLLSKAFLHFPPGIPAPVLVGQEAVPRLTESDDEGRVDYCKSVLNWERRAGFPLESVYAALCRAAPELTNRLLPVAFIPVILIDGESPNALVVPFLLHANRGLPHRDRDDDPVYAARVYHVLLFLLLLWVTRPLFRKASRLPYQRVLASIDALADSLTMSRNQRTARGRWSIGRIVTSLFENEREESYARDPLDSRSVELAFMTLLEEIGAERQPFSLTTVNVSYPIPSVVFVFDELDKIGGVSDPRIGEASPNAANVESLASDRRRSKALHDLLSDMKRLISAAPARFIFVGNRLLHDEYVADHSKREPLLSGIFDADIYLPSLLVDLPEIARTRSGQWSVRSLDFGTRIRQFFSESYGIAERAMTEQVFRRSSFQHLLSPGRLEPPSFLDHPRDDLGQIDIFDLHFDPEAAARGFGTHDEMQARTILAIHRFVLDQFKEEIVGFLAFRSKGIPKKLADTFSTFVRPVGRLEYSHDRSTGKKSDYDRLALCHDVLAFNRSEIYRVQFVNALYAHFIKNFRNRLAYRDDKVTVDVLYMFDYLMKFHARAFSWSSLERMDELVHIHKSPDLRSTLSLVLDSSMGRYLSPVLNGLFEYRFRSEFSAEVSYLSRSSELEMAAMNFTLDESQALKALYDSMIGNPAVARDDLMIALGELHEYDKDFEQARGCYLAAIKAIDKDFLEHVGLAVDIANPLQAELLDLLRTSEKERTGGSCSVEERLAVASLPAPEQAATVGAILSQDPVATRNLLKGLPWFTRRIRLLLRIGLSYEQTRDLERAQTYYFSAHQLSRALLSLFPTVHSDTAGHEPTNRDLIWISQLCSNLRIIVQPAFASAWLAEKTSTNVDASISLVELAITEFNEHLPTRDVGEKRARRWYRESLPKDLGEKLDDTLAMIGASMHTKAGNVYFYKGRPSVLDGNGDLRVVRHAAPRALARALGHYSCALTLSRDFVKQRGARGDECILSDTLSEGTASQPPPSSGTSTAPDTAGSAGVAATPTASCSHNNAPSEDWPMFVRQTVYANLAHLSEAALAMIDCVQMFDELYRKRSRGGGLGYSEKVERGAREKSDDEDGKLVWALCAQDIEPLVLAAYHCTLDCIDDPEGLISKKRTFRDRRSNCPHAVKLINELGLVRLIFFDDLLGKQPSSFSDNLDEVLGSDWKNFARSMLLSLCASMHAERCGLRRAAAEEHVSALQSLECMLKWIRIDLAVRRNTDLGKTLQVDSLLGFVTFLVHLALYSAEEIGRLIDVRAGQGSDSGSRRAATERPENRIATDAATQILGVLLSASAFSDVLSESPVEDDASSAERRLRAGTRDLMREVGGWFEYRSERSSSLDELTAYDLLSEPANHGRGDTLRQQAASARWFARGRLIYLNDRYCFPYLSSLQRLKVLVDDVFLEIEYYADLDSTDDARRFQRAREATGWYEDLVEGAERFDAPSLFPSVMMAETRYLYDRTCSALESSSDFNAPVRRSETRRRDIERELRKADQSISMGQEYYRQMQRMVYLYDDFNDRRVHATQSRKILGATMLGVYRDFDRSLRRGAPNGDANDSVAHGSKRRTTRV